MSGSEYSFSIYPYSPEDELTEKNAVREYEERQRTELADKLSVDIGVIAMAAVTGIAGPEYNERASTHLTAEQSRKFGQTPVRHLISIDRSPLLSSTEFERETSAVREQAILGYTERQAA